MVRAPRDSCAASTGRSSTPNSPKKNARSRSRSLAAIPKDGRRGADRQGMGADIVDVNMGLSGAEDREAQRGLQPDARAGSLRPRSFPPMTRAVKIPVTVKMRAGWNDAERNAPVLAKMVEDAGASAIAVHGRDCSPKLQRIGRLESRCRHRRPAHHSSLRQWRLHRASRSSRGCAGASRACWSDEGVLRNPWILSQAADMVAKAGAPREVTLEDRGRFLFEYIELLTHERVHEDTAFRHVAPGLPPVKPEDTIDGSSTSCARSDPGIPKGLINGSHSSHRDQHR